MTMTNKAVVLTGTSPLFAELHQLFAEKGYQVLSLAQAATNSAAVAFAVEVSNLDLEQKAEEIRQLDSLLAPDVPILTTSLAITATEVASWTKHPERVCGFGTLVPLVERELIELAPALQTEAKTLQAAEAFFQSLGKETEAVNDEVGLVFPRILSLIINEAAFTLMEKAATARDIDIAMKKAPTIRMVRWNGRIASDWTRFMRFPEACSATSRKSATVQLRCCASSCWRGESAYAAGKVFTHTKARRRRRHDDEQKRRIRSCRRSHADRQARGQSEAYAYG